VGTTIAGAMMGLLSGKSPMGEQEPFGFPIAVIWTFGVNFVVMMIVELAVEIFYPSIALI